MKLSKSYRLLKFLNRKHSWASRCLLGGCAAAGTFVATREIALARESWKCFQEDNFKLAFRRCGWYAYRSWIGIRITPDPFFDFTEGLKGAELRALENFLCQRKLTLPRHVWLAEMLYLAAAEIHAALDSGGSDVQGLVNVFYERADELLMQVMALKPSESVHIEKERSPDFSLEDASRALHDFANLFPREVWAWYVISGTFLGVVREGGFLKHDYDIDLGVHAEAFDMSGFLALLCASDDFVIKKIDEHLEIEACGDGRYRQRKEPALIKIIHRTGINIDLFLHHLEGGIRWHGSVIHRWDNRAFELADYELAGIPVSGPADADAYLSENYGNWRVPVKSFDCTTGTPNLVISRNFLSLALFLKRLAVFSELWPDQANRLMQTLLAAQCMTRNGNGLKMSRYI